MKLDIARRRGKRRLPAVFFGVAALAMFAGCGGSSRDSGPAVTVSQAPTVSEPRTEAIRVALVTEVGAPSEYNALGIKGLQDAVEKLRIVGQVFEPRSHRAYVDLLSQLGRKRYDLIISIGSETTAATRRAAKAHPNSMFSIVGYTDTGRRMLPNVEGLAFDEGQAGYLAGYLAGMMTKTGTVSTIGGAPVRSVRGFIAGFDTGARAARPGIKTLNGYANDFDRPARCRKIATRQIERGSDIVFPIAGRCGLGALDVAAARDVWGIGVDTDQSYLGPHILGSAVKNVDVVVFDAIQGVANGAVETTLGTMSPYGFHGGGVTVYGVAYRGVGLGRVSPEVSPHMLARIDAVKRRITGGVVQIPG
jgi:basic membrane protein A